MQHEDLVIALVDYDNVRLERREHTASDVLQNLEEIVERLLDHLKRHRPAREVRVRLYGGWTDFRGHYTMQAEWILAAAAALRGLNKQTRVLPDVVTSLSALPRYRLHGMFRQRPGVPAVQKMVDTLLCCDAVFLGASTKVVVVSDDDDVMVGALAAATQRPAHVQLLRRRKAGSGLNDFVCQGAGLNLFAME